MPRLIRLDTGNEIGTITDAQQAFLVAQLESESDDDDFMIDRDTLDLLSDNDADPELLTLLEKGLDGDEDMSITFEA
ncbi:MAG TPA: hypothetical protein VH143_31650 [Kofleriaceae bacterium]|jgi:hypothetical protein|nr:hypothetical protein [Kofleriaceae bacterium]